VVRDSLLREDGLHVPHEMRKTKLELFELSSASCRSAVSAVTEPVEHQGVNRTSNPVVCNTFCPVPPVVISLEICTPKIVGVRFRLYTVNYLHLK
jgi:hypothetical protein